MPFPLTGNVQIGRRASGAIHQLEHARQPYLAAQTAELRAQADDAGIPSSPAATIRDLTNDYLREVAPIYGFPSAMVPSGEGAGEGLADAQDSDHLLRVKETKEMGGTTTVNYQQTYRGIPVWNAGTSVTVQARPMRVTASNSEVRGDLVVNGPATGPFIPERIDGNLLKRLLNLPPEAPLQLTGSSQRYVFRFEAAKRTDPAASAPSEGGLQGGPPTLPLPPVPPEIIDGRHYVVSEATFQLPGGGLQDLNWVAFVEVSSGAVLYLRARVACVTGMIFSQDPYTGGAGAAAAPNASAVVLNPLRDTVTLAGVNGANPGQLIGNYVTVVDIDAPFVPPPTVADPPGQFYFDAPGRDFAAVNAYHHCDGLFRRMEGMGFNVTSYFDNTAFPVRVDACSMNDMLNAQAPGNAAGNGSDGFRFGLAGQSPSAGIASDVRVVLHEFGHALLWDNVHSPNFGFAHSAGDSLGAILMDPESALRNDPAKRFDSFPWIQIGRRHDRAIADGWAWDGDRYDPFGPTDPAGYVAEQILSTTLFRFYQAIGGDSTDLTTRATAARRAVYLIFRAIGSLGSASATPTNRPEGFATALMNADIGTQDFEGYKGGAIQKVIRWAFEKQGLYQAAGAPMPVRQVGTPPDVDVYIDDGRGGEYAYAPPADVPIWNRRTATPGAGPGDHEAPLQGAPNYLYVRVSNRGGQPAQTVTVLAYAADSSSAKTWPGDFTAVSGGSATLAAPLAAGSSDIVGPIAWAPGIASGQTILAEVSATGDFSNLDARTFFPVASGPMPAEALVRFDNNLALRAM